LGIAAFFQKDTYLKLLTSCFTRNFREQLLKLFDVALEKAADAEVIVRDVHSFESGSKALFILS